MQPPAVVPASSMTSSWDRSNMSPDSAQPAGDVFLASVEEVVASFQKEQQATAMKRMRFLREDAVRRLEAIQAAPQFTGRGEVLSAVDEAISIVQQELAYTADELAEQPVLWEPCNKWFTAELATKNKLQIQRLGRAARNAGEREKLEKLKRAEDKLQAERAALDRQGKLTEADLQKELAAKVGALQANVNGLHGAKQATAASTAGVERTVAEKAKESMEEAREGEEVMEVLRKSLSEVAIELRETQHEIAAKQQELQTMERHITKRTEQVDELEEQQRLGWPQYSRGVLLQHARNQAIGRRRRGGDRHASVNVPAATAAAAKGEGIWAEKAAHLVRRLGVSLEAAAAALAETTGHGGLAFERIEYGEAGAGHSAEDPEGIESLFNAGDEDASGALDARELGTLMHQLTGKALSDDEMQAVLEEMDGDDSGEVELPELRHWLGELRKRGGGDLLKGVSSTAVAAAAVREREDLMKKAVKGHRVAKTRRKPGSGASSSFAEKAAQDARSANAMRAR